MSNSLSSLFKKEHSKQIGISQKPSDSLARKTKERIPNPSETSLKEQSYDIFDLKVFSSFNQAMGHWVKIY